MTRPRTTGTGRKKKTYTHTAVDYSHKREIIERLAQEPKVDKVTKALYPNITEAEMKRKQKQISTYKKQAAFIMTVCDEGTRHLGNYRRRGDATILSAEAENGIVLRLNTMRKEDCPVSAKLLELNTLEVAADERISTEVFRQTTPADAATAKTKFRGDVRAAIIEHNISNVFNADQTADFFEYLPRKTISTRGEKQYG
ncbi:hypothetical protein JG688_00005167 [Phytophthora aleatoria]|uniref:Uncharacterized protein n=1 Tax=Phytophthora aleatoria TaxID=2496075 RepID=A0A8J5IQ27_9STRA|nr:hypothetical protein JG688_00005167 [Phytophthora aleatoria]